VSSAETTRVPQTTVPVQGEQAQKLLTLINKIDDLDDVQNVYSNFDIADEEMERFSA
jgi:transcriptional/translational regulatory protein YebC/TACO1